MITHGWSSGIGSSKAVKYGTRLILNLRQVRPQKIETRPGKHSSCPLSYIFKIFHGGAYLGSHIISKFSMGEHTSALFPADCVSPRSLPLTNGWWFHIVRLGTSPLIVIMVTQYMHQEFWTSCCIARHCGNAGSEKWASTCSVAILDYIEWLGFSDLSRKETILLSRIYTRTGI